jgi:hypothetical protein
MKRFLLQLAFLAIISVQSLHGQIYESYLKEYAEKEAYGWKMKLELGENKTQSLANILLNYKIKEGKFILAGANNFEESREVINKERDSEIKKIFSKQEFKLYQVFNEFDNMDRIEYLKTIVEEYSKDEELVSSIVKYREENILPILRVHRGELDKKISNPDKEALNILRTELFETLDKCLDDCKEDNASGSLQYKSLEDVLFKEIASQVNDKMSPMNHLLQLARKYKSEIDIEKSRFENSSKRWNTDMNAIHEKYILENHLAAFRKTLESNSVVAWKHIRFDAFFLLLDPSTEEEAKKILKLGVIMLPHLTI